MKTNLEGQLAAACSKINSLLTHFGVLFLSFFLWSSVGWGQLSNYSFNSSTGSYTAISGGSVLGNTSSDEQVFNNSTTGASGPVSNTGFPIGFNFTYNGITFDKFAVAYNGYIVLGTGTFSIGNSIGSAISTSTTSGFANVISIANADFAGQTNSELSYLTSGTSPNRTLTIQWKGVKWYGYTSTLNFQIILTETTNSIKFSYGSCSLSGSFTGTFPQVGLRGSSNADVFTRTTTSNWSSTTAGSSTSTCTVSSSILPSNGLVYTFTPPPACTTPTDQATSLVLSSITGTSLSGSFTAASSTPSGYLVVRSTNSSLSSNPVDGTTYAANASIGGGNVVQTPGSSTSFSSTGLSGNTQYYYFVFSYNNTSCSGGPKYLTTSPLTANTTTCLSTPSSLSASSISTTGFTANWSTSLGASGYSLEVATDASFTSTISGSPFTSATNSYTLSGLTSGNTYYYRVTATGGSCNSTVSSNSNTTLTCIAPTSLAASASSSSQTLSTISGAYTAASSSAPSGYMVIRTSTNSQPSPVDGTSYATGQSAIGGYIEYFGTASGNTWTSSNLSLATTYYYWVFSYNTNCSGSPKYSVTTTSFSQSTLSCPTFNATINIDGQTAVPGSSYPTLTAALSDLSTCGITQATTLQITSSYTSSSETFPITINSITGLSSTNTLTIKPASGATPTISGTNTKAIIVLNGCDYVSINGSNNNTNTRDLTITNTNTGTSSAVVWIQTNSSDGSTNNSIKNCIINGSGVTQTLFGIGSGSSSISTTSLGAGNNSNTIQNNNINGVQYGIYSQGASIANKNTGNIISDNNISSSANTKGGIWVGFENNILISSNTISNIAQASSPDVFGISCGFGTSVSATSNAGNEVTNATITKNNIGSIVNSGTFSAYGIGISNSSSGTNLISNNFIYGVASNGTSGDFASGIIIGGGTCTTNIYNNTVSMQGTITGSTPASQTTSCFSVTISTEPVINLRNNIFSNTQIGNTSATVRFSSIALAYTPSTNTTSDYNNLYCSGSGPGTYQIGLTGTVVAGTARTTLTNWKTATGKDANSISSAPNFTSTTDLHLNVSSNCALEGAGTPISGITTDYDGDTRNTSYPDIGADEFSYSGNNQWSGATSTAWSTTSNWSCGSVPTGTMNVVIPSSGITNFPVLSSATAIKDINIGSGTLSLNGQTLTINGAVTGTGTISGSASSNLVIGANAGTLNFTSGSNTLKNLTLNASSSATLGNALDIATGATPGVLTVNTGATLTTGGFLTLKSDATGTARVANNAGSISGEVSVERYIPQNSNRAWRALAVPTYSASQTIANSWQLGTLITGPGGANGLDQSTGGYSMMSYDPTTDALVGVGNMSNVISGNTAAPAAYYLYVRGDRNTGVANTNLNPTATTLSSKGSLYQGTVTVTSANNGSGTTYHLLGNPYVSPINLNSFYTANSSNIDNTFYLFDPQIANTAAGVGGLITLTGSGSSYTPSVTGASYSGSISEIPSGMAFFITKSSGSASSIVFNESMKTTGSTISNGYNGLKTTAAVDGQLQVNLNVKINDSTVRPADGILAIFDANEKVQVDGADARKMSNFGENMSINNHGDLLAIEKRPLFNQDTLHINTTGLTNRLYSLRFNPSQFQNASSALLIDHYTHSTQSIPLQSASEYAFTIDANAQSKGPNRFDVVFEQAALQIATTKKLMAIELYPNPVSEGVINISMHQQKEGNYAVSIVNALGAEIQKENWHHSNGDQIHSINVNKLASGIYYLKISNEFGDQSMHKFIQSSSNF